MSTPPSKIDEILATIQDLIYSLNNKEGDLKQTLAGINDLLKNANTKGSSLDKFFQDEGALYDNINNNLDSALRNFAELMKNMQSVGLFGGSKKKAKEFENTQKEKK